MLNLIIKHRAQLIESVLCVIIFFILKSVIRYLIRQTVIKSKYKEKEEKEIIGILNMLLLLLSAIVFTAIWGVKQSDILLFVSTIFTVLGVALFAEMSILSNITACVVLFFCHPIKIGHNIEAWVEEKEIKGEIENITYFFVFIKTAEGTVTVPNSLFLKSAFTISNLG